MSTVGAYADRVKRNINGNVGIFYSDVNNYKPQVKRGKIGQIIDSGAVGMSYVGNTPLFIMMCGVSVLEPFSSLFKSQTE